MKDKIYDYIKEHPSTTFYELSNNIEGFKGEYDYFTDGNIVFWIEMSEEAIHAIRDLTLEGKLRIVTGEQAVFAYLIDGVVLPLDTAKQPNHKYKKPHWLPLLFTAKESK